MLSAPRSALLLALLVVHVVGAAAWADSHQAQGNDLRVVLLAPQAANEQTTEALARVRGELGAAGFTVVTGEHDGNSDPRAATERAVHSFSALAALAVVYGEHAEQATVDLWVSERLGERTTVQRLSLDRQAGERGATILAVHAVDLLKAALAEHWHEPGALPTVAAEQPAKPPAPDATKRENNPLSGIAAQAGIGVMLPLAAMPTTWAPSLKLSLPVLARAAFLSLTLSGLGSSVDRRGKNGRVIITQAFAALGAGAMFRQGRIVQPKLTAQAGVFRLHGEGKGDYPDTGRSGDLWSFLVAAGGGLEFRLGRRLGLALEALAFATWPKDVVRIGDVEVAEAGHLSLLFDAGLVGRF